ncbi:MAG: restriction endonuclease subunit S [Lachnospiraceae bacterium]|nr:restriction endonuclease subunit S [Lachnospiraceae bacterium]
MTPQELKASILQLAIQGKLVPQLPEEGTGEELFLQIQAEKQALIKSGKIKKEKTLPEITEDEMPFDIPESWKWCRITECGVFISGYTPKPPELSDNGILPYFKVSDMNTPGNELFLVNTCNYLNSSTSKYFLKNTIVYPKNGGAVFTNKKRILAQDSVVDLNTGGYYPIAPLDLMFVYIFFSNIDFRKCYKGTALPTIDMDKLKSKLFPLPPLAEQKRIVAKIEELLPLIDRYEQAWSRLEDFNMRFPVDMQKSILQMAIQGKLVPQIPEEGTGEELFQQIQAEKQRLIKEGKVKKEKPLPNIVEDERPYDIPTNWTWVRFGDLGSYKKGPFGSAITKSMFVPKENGAVKVYEQKNAIQKDATLGDYYISREYFESKMKGFELFPGDIIVSCAGTIGETYVMPNEFEQGIINQALMRMKIFEPLYIPYFLVFFDFVLKKDAKSSSKGSAIKNIPPFEILKNYLVPLPPLAEQKRIVAKLEEILPLCERLK